MNLDRDFKGVWIPKEIWLCKELTALDRVLLAEINSLDTENHCYASNEYFAEFCGVSIATITRSISKLIDKGYIEVVSFDGRVRIIKMISPHNQNDEADCSKRVANNIDNNIDNNPKEYKYSLGSTGSTVPSGKGRNYLKKSEITSDREYNSWYDNARAVIENENLSEPLKIALYNFLDVQKDCSEAAKTMKERSKRKITESRIKQYIYNVKAIKAQSGEQSALDTVYEAIKKKWAVIPLREMETSTSKNKFNDIVMTEEDWEKERQYQIEVANDPERDTLMKEIERQIKEEPLTEEMQKLIMERYRPE